MNRPYIFCHMMTSLDGKIMGNYMDTPVKGECQKGSLRLIAKAPFSLFVLPESVIITKSIIR